MAIVLQAPDQDYYEISVPLILTYPLSLACWFWTTNQGTNQMLMGLYDNAESTSHIADLYYRSVDDTIRARSFAPVPTFGRAISTSTLQDETWTHCGGRFVSTTERSVYFQGVNENTDTTSSDPTTPNVFDIGRQGDSSPANWMDGVIAEIGIWDVALTDAEFAEMGVHYKSPLFIRPENLFGYYAPIWESGVGRLVNYAPNAKRNLDMEAFATPQYSAHPPIIYPAPVRLVVPAPAVGGTTPPYITFPQRFRSQLIR